jgi:hypothetical protein
VYICAPIGIRIRVHVTVRAVEPAVIVIRTFPVTEYYLGGKVYHWKGKFESTFLITL